MIRLFKDEDLMEVLAIEKECFAHPWSIFDFANEISDKYCDLYVLEEDNEVIGYLDIHYTIGEAHLYNIAISKPYQNKGRGKMLLDFLEEQSKKMKCERIWLEVNANNYAYSIYEKQGYKVNRIRKDYYPDGDCIEMVKELHD